MEYVVSLAFHVNESVSVGTGKHELVVIVPDKCILGVNVEPGIE